MFFDKHDKEKLVVDLSFSRTLQGDIVPHAFFCPLIRKKLPHRQYNCSVAVL
eukprot:02385.XXX_44343_44498_1 [CDS] Oithona nana genome sequencing.